MDMAEVAANLGAKLQQGEQPPQFQYVQFQQFQYAQQGSLGRSSAYQKTQSERHTAGTGGEGARYPLQNANKGQQWGPAVWVALLAVAVAIATAAGAVLFASGPDNGDIKAFLQQIEQTTPQNDSEPLPMSSPQKNWVNQHQFGCFEVFTVKEIDHVKYALNSTCPDLPQPMRAIIKTKFSDEHKTTLASLAQNVHYVANNETFQAMGYQLQYSRMPFEKEHRIILFVAGIQMEAPLKHRENVTTKDRLCANASAVIPGWFWSSTVELRGCHDVYLHEIIETATPGLTQQNVTMVVEQLAKSALQQSVIPRLKSHLMIGS